MKAKKSSLVVKVLVLLVVSIFLSLCMAELGMRAVRTAGIAPDFFDLLGRAKPPLDRLDGPGMYYAHPHAAYALKPGYMRGDTEKINSLGFRGEEFSLEKPDDVYRIVAIGGSTTFAVYLPHHQSYPVYLQQQLREQLGIDKIEVINAGMTGSTSAESLHRMFTQVLPLDPDMVVIYHAYNDLFPRVFSGFRDVYYHFRKSTPNNPPGMSRFLVWRLALRALNPMAFAGDFDLAAIVWQLQNLPDSDSDRMENFYTSDSSAFEQNMTQIIKVLRANDIQPVLATFAIKPDVLHWNDYIPPFLWEEGIRENNAAIRRVAERFEVPLVPFAEAAEGKPGRNIWRGKSEKCCYSDSIHMTSGGNVFKAEVFAETIAPIVAEAVVTQ
jgi:lysophospholipase L1-like esterase